MNRGSVERVNSCANFPPGIVGTEPSVIPPVMDWGNGHHRWHGVGAGIIRYSFTDIAMMEGWVGLAVQGDREICWCDLHEESKSCLSSDSSVVLKVLKKEKNFRIWKNVL